VSFVFNAALLALTVNIAAERDLAGDAAAPRGGARGRAARRTSRVLVVVEAIVVIRQIARDAADEA